MSDDRYLEQIRQLVELQKVDDEIFEVNQRKENAPRELKKLESRFLAVESRRKHIQDKLDHLQEQKKRLAVELDDDHLKINKSKDKLMQAGNTREYQAMMREMDSMEKIFRTREEEKTTLLDELQNSTEAMREIDEEYNTLREEYEQKKATLETTLKEADEELAILNDKRHVAGKVIPEPKFQRYEFIRKRLEHPVIVKVTDGICSGCHIAIPPQTFIELQTGQQILSCPNCQRLIFWDQHSPEYVADVSENTETAEAPAEDGPEDQL